MWKVTHLHVRELLVESLGQVWAVLHSGDLVRLSAWRIEEARINKNSVVSPSYDKNVNED